MRTDDTKTEAQETAALYAQADPETRALALKVLQGDPEAKKQAAQELGVGFEEFLANVRQLPPAWQVGLLALFKTIGYGEPATTKDRQEAAQLLRDFRQRNPTKARTVWRQVREARAHAGFLLREQKTIPHREAVKLPSRLLPVPPMQEAA